LGHKRLQQVFGLPQPDPFVSLGASDGLAARSSGTAYGHDRQRIAGGITVEILRGESAAALDDDWHDLLSRADAPNVFMLPHLLRAAPPECRIVALLAWQPSSGNGRRLTGFWAFSTGRPRLSIVPVRVLRAPAMEHAYLSTPVIDRDCLEATLHAMLDAIAGAPNLPNLVALDCMTGAGATYDALMRVLAQRQSGYCHFSARQRPKLTAHSDAGKHLEKALSGSSRKKLRQRRRRLGEKGRLETTVAHAVADVERAFEVFLALEAKGWKGRRGTALLGDPDQAAFARDMLIDLAEAGDAWIYALELDGRAVSMQVVLRAGPAAFTWKTAYDEALSDFSPGVLLFEDYSKALLADPSIAFVDSCAHDDSGYMAAWTERQSLTDLWIDPRPGASIAFGAAAGLHKAYRRLRETAKQAYLLFKNRQTPQRAAAVSQPIPSERREHASRGTDHFVRA
jgi:CelD/BcsL family acetyltransferase involved in cellulose biosynthesis